MKAFGTAAVALVLLAGCCAREDAGAKLKRDCLSIAKVQAEAFGSADDQQYQQALYQQCVLARGGSR